MCISLLIYVCGYLINKYVDGNLITIGLILMLKNWNPFFFQVEPFVKGKQITKTIASSTKNRLYWFAKQTVYYNFKHKNKQRSSKRTKKNKTKYTKQPQNKQKTKYRKVNLIVV